MAVGNKKSKPPRQKIVVMVLLIVNNSLTGRRKLSFLCLRSIVSNQRKERSVLTTA
jgi:hypothetical protein